MLTTNERSLLRMRMLVALLASLSAAGLVVMLVWLFAERMSPPPLDRGRAWLLLPMACWWLWLLRRQPQRLRALWADLRAGQSENVQGAWFVTPRRGIGWLAPMHLQVRVGTRELDSGQRAWTDLLPGQPVIARVAPRSSTLLSVSPQPVASPEEHDSVSPAVAQEWSERDRLLLRLLAMGHSDKAIARETGLSPGSVRTYNSAVFRRLGVVNRADAVAAARRAGIMDVD